MTNTLNWDDVRVLLAALRASSLRQAAATLGVSHPTARRRLNTLESQLGLQLFDRRSDGLHATPEAIALKPAALQVERAMQALGRAAQAADPELRGPIRVTLPVAMATDLLMPDLAAFSARWPQIELDVDPNYGLADLAKREADVAVRAIPVGKLPPGDLTGRKVASIYTAVYGQGDNWIGWQGATRDARWVRKSEFPELPVRGAINHALSQRAACAAGMGLTELPCFFAEPTLTRRTQPKPRFDVWVLVHPDLRTSPRLRVFRDALVLALRGHKARLEGSAV